MAEPKPDETAADRMAIGTGQLDLTEELIRERGLTGSDLQEVADYLYSLAEHASGIAEMALRFIDGTPLGSPLRRLGDGGEVQVCLHHARNLFEAAQRMAGESLDHLRQMDLSES